MFLCKSTEIYCKYSAIKPFFSSANAIYEQNIHTRHNGETFKGGIASPLRILDEPKFA